jgi:hypothetical protein
MGIKLISLDDCYKQFLAMGFICDKEEYVNFITLYELEFAKRNSGLTFLLRGFPKITHNTEKENRINHEVDMEILKLNQKIINEDSDINPKLIEIKRNIETRSNKKFELIILR